jgi:PAS domain S-box-containing protein
VLLATSDATTRSLLRRTLNVGAIEIIDAVDGVEALALARRLDLDLILLDAFLAVMDGISVCSRIRALPELDPPPIVIIGVSSDRAVEVAYAEGADEILGKPLNPTLIRQRARMLLKRRQEEKRMRLMARAVDAAAAGIAILDARSSEYCVTHANPSFLSMTGYPIEEVRGRNLRMLRAEDTDVAAMTEFRGALAAGRPCRVLLRNKRKDGASFWNEIATSPMHDPAGRLTHFVTVQTDVSHIKAREDVPTLEVDGLVEERTHELESALASVESRRRFIETILNGMVSGIIATDPHGVVTFANRAALRTLGTSQADCIGRPVVDVFGQNEALADIIGGSGAQQEYRLDFSVISPGGTRFYVGMSVTRPAEEFREELGFIILFRDLAETLADDTDPRLRQLELDAEKVPQAAAITAPVEEPTEVPAPGAPVPPPVEGAAAARRLLMALHYCTPLELVSQAVRSLESSFPEIERMIAIEPGPELPEILLDRHQVTEALTRIFEHSLARCSNPSEVHVSLHKTVSLSDKDVHPVPFVRIDVRFPGSVQMTERDLVEGVEGERRPAYRRTDFSEAEKLIEANGGRLLRAHDGEDQVLSVLLRATS